MAENLVIDYSLSKKAKYELIMPQLQAIIQGEDDYIANAANICAILKTTFSFFWVGFYFVRVNPNAATGHDLVLGPFQGTLACTRIGFGKGVCGSAWKQQKTIIVPDVNQFDGHIACSSLSQSEIVVPVVYHNQVVAVIDIDSEALNFFDDTDQYYLEKVAGYYSNSLINEIS